MKKRGRKMFAWLLAICMVVGLVPQLYISANESNENYYGHVVNYSPVDSLYLYDLTKQKLQAVKFFDNKLTAWNSSENSNNLNDITKALGWLDNNGYRLNKLGRISQTKDANVNGDRTKVTKSADKGYFAAYIAYGNITSQGNVKNMYKKNDVQYYYGCQVRTVQTRWGLTRKSNDYGKLTVLEEWKKEFKGGGVKDFNFANGVPNLNGMSWKDSSRLNSVIFEGVSDRDNQIDCYMFNGTLVAKDTQGPRISDVKITTDAEGKNELKDGACNLNTIENELKDRTIYFQVVWDEPVIFKNGFNCAKLGLNIKTIGEDGTSGTDAKAYFLNFTPAKTDTMPVMTFEYQIPDPYTDSSSVTQERGYYYSFNKISVFSNENKDLWDNITDISGNPFGLMKTGNRPSTAVETKISGADTVDLYPFSVDNIRITRENDANKTFIDQGELLQVSLELNKRISKEFVYSDDYAKLPELTLNIKDESGEYVTISPLSNYERMKRKYQDYYGNWTRNGQYYSDNISGEWALKPVSISEYGLGVKKSKLTYSIQLYPEYSLDGKTIKVIKVDNSGELKDDSGYVLMNYSAEGDYLAPDNLPTEVSGKADKYKVSPDRQYKMDYIAPEIEIGFENPEDGVVGIIANVSDGNLEGCKASFNISVNGNIKDEIKYQASTINSFSSGNWQDTEKGQKLISVNAPIVETGGENKAYVFVKIPEGSECNSVTADVVAVDEVGIQGTANKTGSFSYDSHKPEVTIKSNGNGADVDIIEINPASVEYAWTDKNSGEPAAGAYSSMAYPEVKSVAEPEGMDENKIYHKTLWVKAKDRGGRENVESYDIDFDKRFTQIIFAEDKNVYSEGYPTANVEVKNATSYWYMWAEQPANYDASQLKEMMDSYIHVYEDYQSNPSTFIEKSYFKDKAEKLGFVGGETGESKKINPVLKGDAGVAPVVDSSDWFNRNVWNDDKTGTSFIQSGIKMGDGTKFPWHLIDSKNSTEQCYCSCELDIVKASETNRPLMLIVGAVSENGETIYSSYSYNTKNNMPDVSLKPYRFTTNDKKGNRQDCIRTGEKEGLFWPEDKINWSNNRKMLNIPNLYDIAEIEFRLAGDPVSGLDRINMAESTVSLVRVTVDDSDRVLEEGGEVEIQSWKLKDLQLHKLCEGSKADYEAGANAIGGQLLGRNCSPIYGFTVSVDPSKIYPDYSVCLGKNEYDYIEYGRVTYEFRLNLKSDNGKSSVTDAAYFAFNNNVFNKTFIDGVFYDRYSGLTANSDVFLSDKTEAVFDSFGNDITPEVQTIKFNSPEKVTLQFETEGSDDWNDLYESDQRTGNLGTYLAVKWSNDVDELENLMEEELNDYSGYSEFHLTDYGAYYYQTPYMGAFEKSGDSLKIYYQFVDSVKKTESPVYVVNLVVDNDNPVIELNVSDVDNVVSRVNLNVGNIYDRFVNETTMINRDDVEMYAYRRYDPEIDGEISDSAFYSYLQYGDKPRVYEFEGEEGEEPYVQLQAEEKEAQLQSEKYTIGKYITLYGYNAKTGESTELGKYVMIQPDENGNYEFNREGYFIASAFDEVENKARFLVNGQPYSNENEELFEDCYNCEWYHVSNIDSAPPEFTEEPKWSEGDGYFTVNAKVDDAENVYIKFDDEYTETLGGESDLQTSEAQKRFGLKDTPGIYNSIFNEETGLISVTVYAKEGGTIKSAEIIAEDEAGNAVSDKKSFSKEINGLETKITNSKNGRDFPEYEYAGSLNFSTPVKLEGINTDVEYSKSFDNLTFNSDGAELITYTDLFGETRSETIYSNLFGSAFAHSIVFKSGGKTITSSTKVNDNVSVTITPVKDVTVDGEASKTFEFSENGSKEYKLHSSLGDRTYKINVTNIDKTVPEPSISVETDKDENGVYSVTYSIVGFNEEGVRIVDALGYDAPSSITFDADSTDLNYTFRYKDEAGNEGSRKVSAEDYNFSEKADLNITQYRLVYEAANNNGIRNLGETMNGQTPQKFIINSAVSVRVEALNASGEVVPAEISAEGSLPEGVILFKNQRTVLFQTSDENDRTVSIKIKGRNNTLDAQVVLLGGSVDIEAPKATLKYITDGNTIKAYLELQSKDIAENGILVVGQTDLGKQLVLKQDNMGYYVEFDSNGNGYFVLEDKAGNTGTVNISVQSIDTKSPKASSEGWYGIKEAISQRDTFEKDLQDILSTPTNNSIKLFFSFDEQISRAEISAWNVKGGKKYADTEEYLNYTVSGNTLTVEFIQNCQAEITVFDLSGNATTLWRPESLPLTNIDKTAPEPVFEPQKVLKNNEVSVTYRFPKDDPVMLLTGEGVQEAYKSEQIITIKENGSKIFTFADKAGNVYTDYINIDEIDDKAPTILMSMDYTGEGQTLSGNDAYLAGNVFTNKNVRILLNITGEKNPDEITITATTFGGAPAIVQKAPTPVVVITSQSPAVSSAETFNYYITAEENEVFEISVADKWGNTNTVKAQITCIDKTPPSLIIGKAVKTTSGISEVEAEKLILKEVESKDSLSGADNPVGDKRVEGTPGVTLTADLCGADLNKEGSYETKITASDRLGNSVTKSRTLIISDEGEQSLLINGKSVSSNDIYIGNKGDISVSPEIGFKGKVNLYWSEGYKTKAQMKDANSINGSFKAEKDGYYTIMVQDVNRQMVIVYVYIY